MEKIEIINVELVISDLEIVNNRLNKIEKNAEKELEAARTKARQIIERARRDSNAFLEDLKNQKAHTNMYTLCL